jgi:hypothetical protein
MMNWPDKVIETPAMSEVSVARLIDEGLVVLYREIKYLDDLSSKGKLEANNAKDLRDHLRLLFELKDRENESLRGLTDDQLKDQVKAVLADETK